MKVIYIPIGFQGAGKTTFCKWMQTHFPEMRYISLDEFAKMVEENNIDENSAMKATLDMVLETYLSSDIDIILDSWIICESFIQTLQFLGFKVVCWKFSVPQVTCIKRYTERKLPGLIHSMQQDGFVDINEKTLEYMLNLNWRTLNNKVRFLGEKHFDQTHLIFDESLKKLNPHDFLFQG